MITCDFHSHFLPGIDDGAKDASQSVEILKYLTQLDVGKVCATPHFSAFRYNVEDFLLRRDSAMIALKAELDAQNDVSVPEILAGAEVRLERGLSETKELDKLCITGTRLLLLEMPFTSFDSWITEEIYNIKFQFGIIPLIAHLNRYFGIYGKDNIEEILSLTDAVFQFNAEVLRSSADTKYLKKLIKAGIPYVFGCDIHRPDVIKKYCAEELDEFLTFLGNDGYPRLSKTENRILTL